MEERRCFWTVNGHGRVGRTRPRAVGCGYDQFYSTNARDITSIPPGFAEERKKANPRGHCVRCFFRRASDRTYFRAGLGDESLESSGGGPGDRVRTVAVARC